MFVQPMIALRPLHYSAEVRLASGYGAAAAARLAVAPPKAQQVQASVSDACCWCWCHAAAAVVLRCCRHAQVSVPTDGVFGCGAHSDYGMLTILATDSVPGLQVGQCGVVGGA